MSQIYSHLGIYSDLVDAAHSIRPLPPLASPGPATRQHVREVLGFSLNGDEPRDVTIESRWERDGVCGELVSWWVGYGPRTQAWVLKPVNAQGRLPGVMALHDHGGFKFYGKEKIADGPVPAPPVIEAFRAGAYGGRAWANALAREGFVVLVSDTFLWGSRRFPLETMPEHDRQSAALLLGARPADDPAPAEVALYNTAAGFHEHLVEKYCALLGTTLSALIGYEDRVAINYLAARPDVLPDHLGSMGLSGGGLRTVLLQATSDRVAAAVVVGLMSTYAGILDHNVASHTWMLYPSTWPRYGDWPDLAACRAPSPLMVQYDLDDELFTVEGMRAADRRLAAHYAGVGQPDNYVGRFYPGPHKLDLEMQADAFGWLKERLGN